MKAITYLRSWRSSVVALRSDRGQFYQLGWSNFGLVWHLNNIDPFFKKKNNKQSNQRMNYFSAKQTFLFTSRDEEGCWAARGLHVTRVAASRDTASASRDRASANERRSFSLSSTLIVDSDEAMTSRGSWDIWAWDALLPALSRLENDWKLSLTDGGDSGPAGRRSRLFWDSLSSALGVDGLKDNLQVWSNGKVKNLQKQWL